MEDIFKKMEIRKQYLDQIELPTAITMDSVQADIEYYLSLPSPSEDDRACFRYDCNLRALLQEGYKLAWANDTLYINGFPRKLP